jgi:predicted DNA-binding transcriptional regulator AlpA
MTLATDISEVNPPKKRSRKPSAIKPSRVVLPGIPQFVTKAEFAAILGVSLQHVSNMITNGTAPKSLKIGPNRTVFALSDVNVWIDATKA